MGAARGKILAARRAAAVSWDRHAGPVFTSVVLLTALTVALHGLGMVGRGHP